MLCFVMQFSNVSCYPKYIDKKPFVAFCLCNITNTGCMAGTGWATQGNVQTVQELSSHATLPFCLYQRPLVKMCCDYLCIPYYHIFLINDLNCIVNFLFTFQTICIQGECHVCWVYNIILCYLNCDIITLIPYNSFLFQSYTLKV